MILQNRCPLPDGFVVLTVKAYIHTSSSVWSLFLIITSLDGHQSLVLMDVLLSRLEIFFSKEDTNGGASLSSTMIDDDEGMSSLLSVVYAAELMDTSRDLFSKYSSYIGLNKLSKPSFDGVEVDSADESSLLKRFILGYEHMCLKAIAASSSNLTWMVSIIFQVLRL
ncbi:hypothetical protein Tco_0929306 [Tanacetum coccineum]